MDINFCIVLFYIFLRDVIAFDKEVGNLYGFFNLRISQKTTLGAPNGAQNVFFFRIFVWFHIKTHTILNKTAKSCFKLS